MDGWCTLQTARWWFTWFHPQRVAPEVTSQKQRGYATRGHCPLHSNNTGWIWRQMMPYSKLSRKFLTQNGVIDIFQWNAMSGECPAPMDTPLPWSTLGLDLGHRCSISFLQEISSGLRRMSWHTCANEDFTHNLLTNERKVNVFNATKTIKITELAVLHCGIMKVFAGFGQCLSYAQIHWCKYEHMKIDTVYGMYMYMKSTLIYSIQIYTVHIQCINIHTSYL